MGEGSTTLLIFDLVYICGATVAATCHGLKVCFICLWMVLLWSKQCMNREYPRFFGELCQKTWDDRSVCLVLSISINVFWQREQPSFCSYFSLSFLPWFPLNPNFLSRIPCVTAATMTGAVSATCSSSPHCTLSALCSQPSLSSSTWW